MKFWIKVILISGFGSLVLWQVLTLASHPPFDYSPHAKHVERIERYLRGFERTEDLLNKQKPLSPAVNYPEAKLFMMLNDKPGARTVLNKMIEEYEELAEEPAWRRKSLEEIAFLAYQMEEYEKAFSGAREVLREYPKNLAASKIIGMYFHLKASEHAGRGDYESAAAEYRSILEYPVASGIDAFGNYFIGQMYEQKGDSPAAVSFYNYIIEKYPELYWAKHAQDRIRAKE